MKILFISFILWPLICWSESSEEFRATKKYEITIQSGIDYWLYTPQYMAGYFLNKNNFIGLKLGHIKSSDEQQTNLALQYKHFTTNSFYVAPEVFYLNTYEEGFGSDDYYTSLGFGIRIGNQWTWEYFTIGADWVGVGRRFINFKRRDESSSAALTFTLANVYFGISF